MLTKYELRRYELILITAKTHQP